MHDLTSEVFGLHLIHSHFHAPADTVLMGEAVSISSTAQACWTKPITSTLEGVTFHGHVFSVRADGQFIAYEYHKGELNKQAHDVSILFSQELASFLLSENLNHLLALEVLDASTTCRQKELQVGPLSTVLFDEQDILALAPATVTTGWSFTIGHDGVISCKGGTTYAQQMTKETHRVFVDGKPLLTDDDLVAVLREEGLIT